MKKPMYTEWERFLMYETDTLIGSLLKLKMARQKICRSITKNIIIKSIKQLINHESKPQNHIRSL